MTGSQRRYLYQTRGDLALMAMMAMTLVMVSDLTVRIAAGAYLRGEEQMYLRCFFSFVRIGLRLRI